MTGNEIQELRESLQLTRRGFAKLVNVSAQVLRRWEFHGDKQVLLAGHTKEMLRVLSERVSKDGVTPEALADSDAPNQAYDNDDADTDAARSDEDDDTGSFDEEIGSRRVFSL